MVYKATRDVVQRVMPLLDQLAGQTIDKARLLQYLSARAGADWGVLRIVADRVAPGGEPGEGDRLFTFQDIGSGSEYDLRYPACLPGHLDDLVRDEYKRLAVDRPLTSMARPLFDWLYADRYCGFCRWRGAEYDPFHRECWFAGSPVNFEAAPRP